jgi:hypothetical protein
MPENDQGAAPERPTPRLWYMAAVLCLVNTVGFVDRQSLPLLVIQIEQDLHISDTEMSLLIGLAFVLVFALGTSFFTIGTAAIAKLTPSTMVGKVSSLHFFSVGVCGTAIAPFLIAAVSDGFFSGPAALGASLATVCGTLDVIAIVCYAILYKVMREPAAL